MSKTKIRACGLGTDGIVNFTDNITKALDIKEFNFDVEAIVKRLGGTIVYGEIGMRPITGSLKVTGERKFEIKLPCVCGPLSRRFYMARQLGRLFLHSQYCRFKITHKHDYNGTMLNEADWFAMAFLMPTPLMRELVSSMCPDPYKNMLHISAICMVPQPVAENWTDYILENFADPVLEPRIVGWKM